MKIIVATTLLFLSSCIFVKKKPEEKKEIKSQAIQLSEQYHASLIIDTSNFHFTYQFQDALKSDSLFILNELELCDIKRNDSVLVLSVFRPSNQGGILFDLKCSPEQIKKVFAELPRYYSNSKDSLKGFTLIVEIEKIKKFRLNVTSKIDYQENEEDNEAYSYLLIDNPDLFHCTGVLVDLIKK